MSPEIKTFLEQHKIELLENNFTKLYKDLSYDYICELSEVLLKSGITPLEYMIRVPNEFLYGSAYSIRDFKIPSNIISIGKHSFSDTDLVEVVIPEGVKIIDDRAFSGCSDLTTVYLPSTLEELGRSIFARCLKLKTVVYNGTFDQFENTPKWDQWISPARSIDVLLVCKDKQEMVR